MQFITTDQRIAVENFQIGLIYTVTFTGGRYFSGACIGKGADFVMFQRTAPELVYCLNMTTAAEVESIEQTGGGGGTHNYNDLYNKPQINGVELAGNKSLDNLGIQAKLTFDSAPTEDSENPVQSGGVYSALDQKQNVLSSTQLSAVNSGITSDDVAQITTNKNNISLLTPDIKRVIAFSGGTTYSMVSDCTLTLVADDIAPVYRISGVLGQGSAGIRGIILSKSNNSADFDTDANVLCKAEQSSGIRSTLACDDIWFNLTDNPRYVYCWVKLASNGTGRVYTIAERLG